MIKVYTNQKVIDGIARVVEAQRKFLPQFGIEITDNIKEAHIICNHGAALEKAPGIPIVNVNHGLYWSRQPWGDDFMDVNRDVVESMICSVAHTVPSEWVGTAVRRGGYFYPEVVYHGVTADDFKPIRENKAFVLWNKARADFVSDPRDLMRVSQLLRHFPFVTTIGQKTENVQVIGTMPYSKMKEVVAEAGVYLATVRETFGIGTLEALASGVPVAGWNWGGQAEIIVQGETGYLAPPGDFKALAHCIELCYAERSRLSANAVDDVRKRWRWEPRIEQYANIFKRVYSQYYENKNRPKVSVIVTAYNLDGFLPKCLDSVKEQTFTDFECVVVDDAGLSSTRKIVEDYARSDKRFHYKPTPHNLGLPGARNFGLQNANGKYIRHLDADDYLADNAIELEANALDRDPSIHVVYGHLEVTRTDGSRVVVASGDPVRSGWPPEKFNWYYQMAHLNQLPSCAMARREVYERSGGYRERSRRNEDAEFWCRVSSLGFRIKKITQAVTYFHRERHDSKGAQEWATEGGEPDWTAWFPWRLGATNIESAQNIIRSRGETPRNIHLVPFGAQGPAPKDQRFWYIHDYAYPVVSIIVTCGPGHKQYLLDALDSIQAQTYPDWECVVVNDTGNEWPKDLMGAPWAKVVNMLGNQGASAARNEGYKHIHPSSRFVVWLDADDYWLPWFLHKAVLYAESNDGAVYSDFIEQRSAREFKLFYYRDFESRFLMDGCATPGSSVLIPRKYFDAVIKNQGGWDTEIAGLEDWDLQMALCHAGCCFYHLPEPLFVYRMYSTTKRESDYQKVDIIKEYMDEKWSVYRKEGKQLMCGCSTPKKLPMANPISLLTSSGNFSADSIEALAKTNNPNQMVTVEYLGPLEQTFTLKSKHTREIVYRFGNNATHKIRPVLLVDAQWMVGMNDSEGQPTYKIVGIGSAPPEVLDPSGFLGQPVSV